MTTKMENAITVMQRQGLPRGLARELYESKIAHPIRFWMLDNSGSMLKSDGRELRSLEGGGGGGFQNTRDHHDRHQWTTVPCTRWAELKGCVTYHARLAALLEATTIFRFVNDPGARVGPQEFIIAGNIDERTAQEDLALALPVLKNVTPKGSTPLTTHLQDIRLRIEAMQDLLRNAGQSAVIVLATDG